MPRRPQPLGASGRRSIWLDRIPNIEEALMKIEHSDSHTVDFLDDAGVAFMAITTHRLNEALKRHGVEGAAQRQEICASFLFEFSYHHDAGWLIHQSRKLFPMVVFAARERPSGEENLAAVTELHVPTQTSSWHEYANGVVSKYFEDDEESVPGLQTGSYDIVDE
jgi:hypothetical protein